MTPEHKFPAAFDDCFAVTKALAEDKELSKELGINPNAMSVAGDSAGGGLTAAVALEWHKTGLPNLRTQLLIYPYLQMITYDTPSYISEDRVGTLNKESLLQFSAFYLWGDGEQQKALESKSPALLPEETWSLAVRRLHGEAVDIDLPPADRYPYAAPLLSEKSSPLLAKNTSGVAPALVFVAQYDPLRSEGEMYVSKLRAHGVDASLIHYDHESHSFHACVAVHDPDVLRRNFLHNPNADDVAVKMNEFIKLHSP